MRLGGPQGHTHYHQRVLPLGSPGGQTQTRQCSGGPANPDDLFLPQVLEQGHGIQQPELGEFWKVSTGTLARPSPRRSTLATRSWQDSRETHSYQRLEFLE